MHSVVLYTENKCTVIRSSKQTLLSYTVINIRHRSLSLLHSVISDPDISIPMSPIPFLFPSLALKLLPFPWDSHISILSHEHLVMVCAVAPAQCQRRLALSMGKGNFRSPTESASLNRSQKIVTGDYDGDSYSCAQFGVHPFTGGASGRMGEI